MSQPMQKRLRIEPHSDGITAVYLCAKCGKEEKVYHPSEKFAHSEKSHPCVMCVNDEHIAQLVNTTID
jgi:DNA-directed RNA polymerase subunit RPC12/RpoP